METRYTTNEILHAAHNVRKQVLRMAIERVGSYLGQANSSAEIISTLYMRVLNIGESLGNPEAAPFPGVPSPENMNYPKGSLYNGPATSNFDRFFLSPAHYAVVLYCVLAEFPIMPSKNSTLTAGIWK